MKKAHFRLSTLTASALLACSGAQLDPSATRGADGVDESALTAATKTPGAIPAGLPSRLTIGLMEDSGGTWMKTSGAKWDSRYRYLTKGWSNNWGWSANDGSFALNYMKECDAQGTIPVFSYYIMSGEPGGGEAEFYAKTKAPSTMADYFGDFRLLMQRVRDFGKPVVVLLEADGFAYMEQQTGDNPNAYAAVAASGLPEFAKLPNTAAGWGLAFLQLRNSVGASSAILGAHVSGWASGKDIEYGSVTDPLQPEVDKVYNFLAPLGLAANATGSTFDVMVADPLDRDSDYYRVVQGQDRTWDPSDTAPIASKSFNRFGEWLRLFNVKASKRWMLWQIPLGNSNHLNKANDGSPRAGYKDNRPEYFFGPSRDAHLAKFADDGVISLLFGGGASGMSGYTNDIYTDGQPFMKSRAGAFVNAGGLALGSGGTTTPPPPSTPPPTPDAGAPPPPAGDTAQYGFESGVGAWTLNGTGIAGLVGTTAKAFAGKASLEVRLSGAAGKGSARVGSPATAAGQTVTFRVQCAAGTNVTAIQPYVLQGAAGGWAYTGAWRAASSLTPGAWNAVTVTVPSNAATPLFELGLELTTAVGAANSCLVDAVTW